MINKSTQIGGSGGGRSAPNIAPDSLSAQSSIELIDAISEGEIEGFDTSDPYESVYFNGTPARSDGVDNFEDIFIDHRVGTQNQTHMEGESDFDNPNASVEINVSTNVDFDNPVSVVINNSNVDAIVATITFPGGLLIRDEKGNVSSVSVDVSIGVKASGQSTFQLADLKGRGSINEKTSSRYSRSFNIGLKQFGDAPYEIQVSRNTADPDNSGLTQTVNEFSFQSYTEVIYAKLRYPNTAYVKTVFSAKNNSSAPRRGFLTKGIICRVPNASVYDPIQRTYTGGFWDGTFDMSWTRNPVWCLYDLLTNPRYGLGKEIDESLIDKWSLFEIAKRCDELVDNGFGDQERRYSLDLYVQKGEDARKVANDIASSFAGMIYWGSRTVHVVQDSPKTVKAIFTNANVIDGKFTYTGSARQTRYTVALVQWNDPTDGFKTTIEYVEDPDGVDRYGYVETTATAVGCTSRAMAHRFGKRLLVTGRLETDIVSFSLGLEGMVVSPGDVIGVRDVIRTDGNRLGGRIKEGSTSSSLVLDSPVTIETSDVHYISVVMTDGTIETKQISNGIGEHSTISTTLPLNNAPDALNIWAIHTDSNDSKYYRIISISEGDGSSRSTYDISAVEYIPEKYDIIDSPLSLQDTKTISTAATALLPPSNLVVSEVKAAGDDFIKRHLDISWEKSSSRFVKEHVLGYSIDGSSPIIITDLDNSYRIINALPGQYHFEVYAKSIIGLESPKISSDYTVTSLLAVTDVSVTNVQVRGIGSEFFGRTAEFSWETDADVVLNLPTIYSNGSGGASKWFRDFEVKIFDGLTELRTEYVTGFSYEYTFEKNVEDGGPRRSVTIKVRARDEFGGYSNEGSLTVTNNPPSLPPSASTIPSEGSLVIKFDPPTDPDYKSIRIFGSRTTGFVPDDTPSTGNLIWEGSETYITIPIRAEDAGTWYLRAQFVDEFGTSGTTYTDEWQQDVFPPQSDLDPVIAADILRVIDDFDKSNNRNSSPVSAPTIPNDGTSIDHTLNDDGTVDVSFEWGWAGNEGDIDGFGIYTYLSDSPSTYVFNGLANDEYVFIVPAYKRSYIWRGVSADKYYTIGVVAYRKVDADINAIGVINSAIIQPSLTEENPYHPKSIDPASGDIRTTINGILANHVNDWDFVTGNNRPFDNADVTADQIAGSGINILNPLYSIIDDTEIPPYIAVNGASPILDVSNVYFGKPSLKISASQPNAQLFFGSSTDDFNFIITPNKKWILSVYVKSSTANASGQVRIRTSDSSQYYSLDFLTSPTPNTITRVSGMIDLSLDPSSLGLMRVDVDSGAGTSIIFQAFMMEEMVGNIVAPSAYSRPSAVGVGGVALSDVLNAIKNFNSSNDRNANAITPPLVASDGSALNYTLNHDGTSDVSFKWSWNGDEGDIDGFAIFTFSTETNHGVYTFGTNPDSEIVFQVPANKRSHIERNVSAINYYTVAVLAYRSVDKDIDPDGLIYSGLVYANGVDERPFRPTNEINFDGNLNGSVGGTSVGQLLSNALDGVSALNAVSDITNDNLITPAEKVSIDRGMSMINSEKIYIEALATQMGITTKLVAYQSAYADLTSFVSPILLDMNSSSNVDGDIFATKLLAYFDARDGLNSEMSSRASETANWSDVYGVDKPENGATKGAPNGTFVGGTLAEDISTSITDFNSLNNLISDPIVAPTGVVLTSDLKDGGSADISVSWSWSGNEGDIDGFIVTARLSSSSTAYTIGTTTSEEVNFVTTSDKRNFIATGQPSNEYYFVAVTAYRSVSKSISANGVIKSSIAQATAHRPAPIVTLDPNVQVNGENIGDLSSNASNALATAMSAEATANSANAAVSDFSDDDKLTPNEKSRIKEGWDAIFLERPGIVSQASSMSVSSSAYSSAYNVLYAYLEPILGLNITNTSFSNSGVTTSIIGSDLRSNVSSYFYQKQELLNSISDEASKQAEWASVNSRPNSLSDLNASDGADLTGVVSETSNYRQDVAPSNSVIPNSILVNDNSDGSRDVVITWGYTQGSIPTDGFIIYYAEGHGSLSSANAGFQLGPETRTYTFTGIPQDRDYRCGIATFRRTDSGIRESAIDSPTSTPDWRVFSKTANITANIDGVSPSELSSVATETSNYRQDLPPTNDPIPTVVNIYDNDDGSRDIAIYWAYTQGALPADGFEVFYRASSSTPVVTDASVQVSAGSLGYRFYGVPQDVTYRAGIAAYRRTESGIKRTSIISPTTSPIMIAWAKTPDIKGTIDGESASSIAAVGSETSNYRQDLPPTNNPTISAYVQATKDDGSRDIRLNWTYTQGLLPADGFIIYYMDGTGTPVSTSASVQVGPTSTSYLFQGIPQNQAYSAGIASFRRTESGLKIGSIVSNSNWQVPAVATNITANIQGQSSSSLVTKVNGVSTGANNTFISGNKLYGLSSGSGTDVKNSAISINSDGTLVGGGGGKVTLAGLGYTGGGAGGNYTISSSDPSGGGDGDFHYNGLTKVLWSNIDGIWYAAGTTNADQITSGTLSGDRITSGAITSSHIAAGQIQAAHIQVGALNAMTMDTSGYVRANGQISTANGAAAVAGNDSRTSPYGVIGYAGGSPGYSGILGLANPASYTSGVQGVSTSNYSYGVYGSSSGIGSYGAYGISTGQSGFGVYAMCDASYGTGLYARANGLSGKAVHGYSSNPGGYGVYADCTSGTALYVNGKMQITNSTLVTNLNADLLDGMQASSFCSLMVTENGNANASGSGFTFQSTVTGQSTFGSGNGISIQSVSDERLKKDIDGEKLGLDFINSLKPKTYRWKLNDEIKYHGFIAQDVEKLAHFGLDKNDSLMQDRNGVKGVDYVSLIAPMVNAIQDLSSQVDKLTKELQEIKNG